MDIQIEEVCLLWKEILYLVQNMIYKCRNVGNMFYTNCLVLTVRIYLLVISQLRSVPKNGFRFYFL